MTKQIELLPCPFCGEIPESVDEVGENLIPGQEAYYWEVQHYCDSGFGESRDEAVKNWNTRYKDSIS